MIFCESLFGITASILLALRLLVGLRYMVSGEIFTSPDRERLCSTAAAAIVYVVVPPVTY